jgi:hypothetical protein
VLVVGLFVLVGLGPGLIARFNFHVLSSGFFQLPVVESAVVVGCIILDNLLCASAVWHARMIFRQCF